MEIIKQHLINHFWWAIPMLRSQERNAEWWRGRWTRCCPHVLQFTFDEVKSLENFKRPTSTKQKKNKNNYEIVRKIFELIFSPWAGNSVGRWNSRVLVLRVCVCVCDRQVSHHQMASADSIRRADEENRKTATTKLLITKSQRALRQSRLRALWKMHKKGMDKLAHSGTWIRMSTKR